MKEKELLTEQIYMQYFEIQPKTETFFPFLVEVFQCLSVSQEFQFLFRPSYVGTDIYSIHYSLI